MIVQPVTLNPYPVLEIPTPPLSHTAQLQSVGAVLL
jgi:hypothetical protein